MWIKQLQNFRRVCLSLFYFCPSSNLEHAERMKQSQHTLTPLTDELSYRSLPGVREYVVYSNERIWTATTMVIVSAMGILLYTTVSMLK